MSASLRMVFKNFRYLVHLTMDEARDRRFGVETGAGMRGIIPLSDLAVEGDARELGNDYAPTPYGTIRQALRHLPRNVTDFTFVDFGSGKGRVLLSASDYDFKEIIGVEFAKELHESAQKNISNYRSDRQKCFSMTSELADATQFAIPAGNCILFFSNPFDESLMQKIASNIKASFHENPRKIVVMYYNPISRRVFDELKILRLEQTVVDRYFDGVDGGRYTLLIYEGLG